VVDVHAHVARLTQVWPQVAVVPVVARADVEEVPLVVDPGAGLLRADPKRGVLQRQPGVLAGKALQVAFPRVANGDQVEHGLDRVRPDPHPVDHVWLVETLLAAHISRQGDRLPVHADTHLEPVDDPAGLDPFDDGRAGVDQFQRQHATAAQPKLEPIAVIHLQRAERVFGRHPDHLAPGGART